MEPSANIIKTLSDSGFDSAMFLDPINQYYLTGFFSTDGVVVITESETALMIDSRYYEAAARAKSAGDLKLGVTPYLLTKRAVEALSDYIKQHSLQKLAFDKNLLTVNLAETLTGKIPATVEGVADITSKLRQIKDPEEIKRIKTAQEINDGAFKHILGIINKDMTELQLAAEIEYYCKRHGGEKMAFDTIAVAGKNSSLPHGEPSDSPLGTDTFVTMDFGTKYKGYCSDMTRTIVIGKATPEMKQVYETVLTAHNKAIDTVREGVLGSVVDAAARDHIVHKGYGDYFGHSTGHSLGLEIHESPRFASGWSHPIPAGAVMTVEPGIYLPGQFGVRIEDMVLVTKEGSKNLTGSPKQLIEI